MSLRSPVLVAVATALLLVLAACTAPAAAPTPEPRETEAAETEAPEETEEPDDDDRAAGSLEDVDLCLLSEDELAEIFETDAIAISYEHASPEDTGWCGYEWDGNLFVVTTTDTTLEEARTELTPGEEVDGIANGAWWWTDASILFVEFDEGVLQMAHVDVGDLSEERQLEVAREVAELTAERLESGESGGGDGDDDGDDDGGDTAGFSLDALFSRIPPNVAENCEAHPNNDFRLITAECLMPEDSEVDYVAYTLAVDADEYAGYYERLIEALGITETDAGSCPDAIPSEETYTIGGEDVGLLACTVGDGGHAIMIWTDDRLQIVSYAERRDDDIEALYEWWTGPESGPLQ